MRGWTAWILMGIGLALAILLGTCVIGLARLSPTLVRRLARSALAVAALSAMSDIVLGLSQARRD